MRRTRDEWTALLADFRQSGLGLDAFAKQRGLKPRTFRWWYYELGGARMPAPPPPVTFVPVQVAPAATAPCRVLEARFERLTVRFEVGTALDYVSALLLRLSASC